jgi:FkbM family methyltransferase
MRIAALLRRTWANLAMTPPVLAACGLKRGVRIRFHDGNIDLEKDRRTIRISQRNVHFTVDMAEHFDAYFGSVLDKDGLADFSRPALHTLRHSGVAFYFPSIPEEEAVIESYCKVCQPSPGETVFDVGAHAGASTYFLSRAVGPGGRVVAFEPDPTAYEFLQKNVTHHRLDNVTTVQAAMSDRSGTLPFRSEGTIGSALSTDESLDGDRGSMISVESLTLEAACDRIGAVPSFIKMDVEGAEVGIISSSAAFLSAHAIRFAIDTNHIVQGAYTSERVECAFRACEYTAETVTDGGFLTTFARR